MLFVKRLACTVRELSPLDFIKDPDRRAKAKATPCNGPVEADHMGARGMGQKADDDTTAPVCRNHHSERHAHAGTFFHLTRDELRAWRAEAIERSRAAWSNR